MKTMATNLKLQLLLGIHVSPRHDKVSAFKKGEIDEIPEIRWTLVLETEMIQTLNKNTPKGMVIMLFWNGVSTPLDLDVVKGREILI